MDNILSVDFSSFFFVFLFSFEAFAVSSGKKKSTNIMMERKKKILDTYGGSEYLDGRDGLAHAALNKDGSVMGEADGSF